MSHDWKYSINEDNSCTVEQTGYTVATTYCYVDHSNTSHIENAQLICAAPDLLDVCHALYDHFLTTGGKEDSLLGMQVKEALKKARGE